MKEDFVRKLILHNSRGVTVLNVPKKIRDRWARDGMTHCRLVYDTEENTVLIKPF